MQRHVDEGLALLDAASRFEARDTVFELDMAYVGQTHTVAVPLPVSRSERGRRDPRRPWRIEAAFDAAYLARPTGGC
jgi:N-methylhydantoinase A